MTPHQAVAVLGLYLRSRDDYQFTNIASTTQETFFDTLTEAVLPAHWRWFGGCLASRLAGNSEAPTRLARTTPQRVNRTLRARGDLHQQYFTPTDEGAMQDAHSELDTILQQLAGAFDAVARVANRVYGIDANPNRVKWAWDWRTSLASADKDLAAFMDDGRWARDVYDVLSMLRNTIHGEGLDTVVHGVHRQGITYGITLGSEDMAALLVIARRRGGLDRWGIGESRIPLPGYEHFIVADRFVEALVPDAIRALNALMRLTKVELLPGVDGASLRKRPPNSRRDMFSNSWTRRRFRLLAGLSLPVGTRNAVWYRCSTTCSRVTLLSQVSRITMRVLA